MTRIIRFLARNWLWKLASLVAAIAIWMSVSNEPELATIVTVPVEYSHFPKNLEISSSIVDSIDVEARGPSGLLRSLHDSRIAAIIDFSSVRSAGERTFTVTPAELKLPRGIQIVRTIPAQLRFTFDRHATREVPVDIPYSGRMPAGFAIVSTEVQPATLRIGGPASQVEATAKLKADPFDVSNVNSDTQETLSVYAAEPEVRILDTPQVRVKIHVVQRKR